VMAPLEAEYDQQPTAANETLAPAAAAALVKAPALEEVQHVRLHTPPLTYEIAHAPQNVHFSAAGTGCAVLNTRVVWRTAQPPPPPPPPVRFLSTFQTKRTKDKKHRSERQSSSGCFSIRLFELTTFQEKKT